ncbi:MAG: HypC/HybG/HupF family hydrogenase formation chaperone [Pseudomonadota bacterium]
MCLGIPAKVEEIDEGMAVVSIGETTVQVSVVLLDGLSIGDYVLVHAGFAIAKIDENEALETLSLIKELIPDEVCG